jgi:hypothetical protein
MMKAHKLEATKEEILTNIIEVDALITTLYQTASVKDDGFILMHEDVRILLKIVSQKIQLIEDYFYQ